LEFFSGNGFPAPINQVRSFEAVGHKIYRERSFFFAGWPLAAVVANRRRKHRHHARRPLRL